MSEVMHLIARTKSPKFEAAALQTIGVSSLHKVRKSCSNHNFESSLSNDLLIADGKREHELIL